MEAIKTQLCFGGTQTRHAHDSRATGTRMVFSVYLPPQVADGRVPVLYFLSGLTCTDENFSTKSGAQRYAAEHGVALVMPDTSPRGLGLPGEDDSSDFGTGAGFYVDATEEPWSKHYQMYTYVTAELPDLVRAGLPVDAERQGIFGHSMGGHGALVCGLRNPDRFRSISAFAPICSPRRCPWGQKALRGYLGDDEAAHRAHDATDIVQTHSSAARILVDQGTDDPFLEEQLKPDLLEQACQSGSVNLELRRQSGYDHGYYFIASFVGDHIAHHAAELRTGA